MAYLNIFQIIENVLIVLRGRLPFQFTVLER